MTIPNIQPTQTTPFINTAKGNTPSPSTSNPTTKTNPIDTALDKFNEKLVNQSNINDTVQVPRNVFKGYICFFLGTSTGALINVAKKGGAAANILKVATAALTSLGTFEFVKPYLIKQSKPQSEKTKDTP